MSDTRKQTTGARIGLVLRWLGLVSSVAVAGFLAFAPLVPTQVFTIDSAGRQSAQAGHESLLEVGGVAVLLALAVPVLIAGLPLIWGSRWAPWVAAGFLACFAVLTRGTVGVYFLPVIGILTVAGFLRPSTGSGGDVDLRQDAAAESVRTPAARER